MLIFAVTLLVIAIIMLIASVKSCSKNECLAIFKFGDCVGLNGSGYTIIIPAIYRVVRIKYGDKGELLEAEKASINGVSIPVIADDDISIGSTIRVTGIEYISEPNNPNMFFKGRAKIASDVS